MPDTIIFSDLDGTLLDAADYSFAAARPALALIEEMGVPLVLCSSKTRAEIETCRQHLHNRHPFIAENGGGIFIPQGYFREPPAAEPAGDYLLVRMGLPHHEIRQRFERLREQLGARVRGFSDMDADEVAALTGLGRAEAALAQQRDFDEAFVFDGAPDEAFLQAIEADGLHWTRGEYFHILGNHDKGRAVQLLQEAYRREFGSIASIGLGDSPNDLPMLRAVERPVLVRHANGHQPMVLPGLLHTHSPGAQGWNEAVLQLLAAAPAHEPGMRIDAHAWLAEILDAALAAADPYQAVLNAVRLEDGHLQLAGVAYELDTYDRIVVAGAGKAAARMALALEELLGERIAAGLVIVKHGHTAPLRIVEQVEASHPVPDEAGVAGTRRMLEMLRSAGPRTLAICPFSGGASALLVAPVDGVTLADKQQTTELLLRAGADIGELNAVRKHLSAIKGGRLAQATQAQVLTLLLSDVIGDRLDVIASGPTAPDASTFADAWVAVQKYGLEQRMPLRVAAHLQRGLAGQAAETVKDGAACLQRVYHNIVGSSSLALEAAAAKARQLGCVAEIVDTGLQGESRMAARCLAQDARARLARLRPGEHCCLLYGGETTVTVRGAGRGGRNQELALAFALETEGTPGIALLAAGTDGTDGPTDAAGAIVDGTTAAEARHAGIDPRALLDDNDSYAFFERLDQACGSHAHLKTGPTGTNVMDIDIVLCTRDKT